ncbi:hypothetical protein MRB53_032684 [Persea americana]|uniref:Uncharacterized protein n=1 Tax=Persea americana TaxID=3435 RepID=A0ACC2KSJ6_PERAE|nr:hypothetical protein MRB53_032684 [Persea americana]
MLSKLLDSRPSPWTSSSWLILFSTCASSRTIHSICVLSATPGPQIYLHVYLCIHQTSTSFSMAELGTSSASTTPSFVISNISNLVSIKVDRHNYLLWRAQFEPLLMSHDLMGFVDGSNPCPEKYQRDKDEKVISMIDPAILNWNRQDQNLLSWIHATLSEHVLSQVVSLRTSHAVWTAIERHFASLYLVHTIELKRQLQSLQKGSLSITNYLLKHKITVDELSAIGHFVDESDQVTHILDGLLEEYDPVVINVTDQTDHVSVAYVHGLLLIMEM